MVGATVAAVAAVGSLGIAAYGMSQQQGIADQQANFQNAQLGFEQQQWNAQAPYREQLSQLMADPSSVSKLPSYQFFKQQGEESVARQFAANPGGAGSVALEQYGQNYASSAYEQQIQLLAQLSGISNNPASYGSVGVGAGGNAVSAQNNSFNQLQQLLAQGGAVTKMFGPGGAFASAGTPASTPWMMLGPDPNAGTFAGGFGPPGG